MVIHTQLGFLGVVYENYFSPYVHVMLTFFFLAIMLHNQKYDLVLSDPVWILGSGNNLLRQGNKGF